ncbi:hypothetical protein HNR60_003458 [Rhodopseudomonas rhenobacensis]|uniref:Uncharacterized protein n=1 Tax=Rhodopseudomonas rhenobacensis TaxID=87461 RepID=A0A7W7Z6G2_9BRAD|nr:hypothetical protein [Rhodopseudomonas rhenobacensis]
MRSANAAPGHGEIARRGTMPGRIAGKRVKPRGAARPSFAHVPLLAANEGRRSAERRALSMDRSVIPGAPETRGMRKRLPALHRGDFALQDRASGHRRDALRTTDPGGFPPFACAASSQPASKWQTLLMGPDGDPERPECEGIRPPLARRRRLPLHRKTPHEAPLANGMGEVYVPMGVLSSITARTRVSAVIRGCCSVGNPRISLRLG